MPPHDEFLSPSHVRCVSTTHHHQKNLNMNSRNSAGGWTCQSLQSCGKTNKPSQLARYTLPPFTRFRQLQTCDLLTGLMLLDPSKYWNVVGWRVNS